MGRAGCRPTSKRALHVPLVLAMFGCAWALGTEPGEAGPSPEEALLRFKLSVGVFQKGASLSSWSESEDMCRAWQGITCSSAGQVTAVDLSDNGIHGMLDGLSPVGLESLETLDLHNNSLAGCLPEGFSRLTNLSKLFLNENQLGCKLPPSWGDLQRMEFLYLDDNQLSGALPRSWGNMASLQLLRVNNNRLSWRHVDVPEQMSKKTVWHPQYPKWRYSIATCAAVAATVVGWVWVFVCVVGAWKTLRSRGSSARDVSAGYNHVSEGSVETEEMVVTEMTTVILELADDPVAGFHSLPPAKLQQEVEKHTLCNVETEGI